MKGSLLEKYFSRTRGHIEPGVWRIQKLLGEKCRELSKIKTVLVTGTNGKGTFCRVLEQIVLSSGALCKVAVYSSPHLVSGCERIRINGEPVRDEMFEEALRRVEERLEFLPDATFFEISTAAVFEIVLNENIGFFICEVGLGGRLDSTNCLSPFLSVLVSVALDHQEILGNTCDQIAYEKTFVSRKNRPYLIGDLSLESRNGVEKAIQKTKANLVEVRKHSLHLPFSAQLHGPVEMALSCLELLNEPKWCPDMNTLMQAFQKFRMPGRMDLRLLNCQHYLLDGAHNSDGVLYFIKNFESFKLRYSCMCLVFASFKDKDFLKSISHLRKLKLPIVFTSTNSERSCSKEDFVLENGDRWAHNVKIALSSAKQLLEFHNSNVKENLIVCVGSLSLVGEVFSCLGLQPFDFSSCVWE